MSSPRRPSGWTEGLLLASFALATAAFGGMAWYSWREAERYAAGAELVGHSHQVMEAARGVEAAIGGAISVQRAYLLSGEKRWLLQLDIELSRLETELLNLRFLTIDNPEQRRRLDGLERRLGEWRDALMDNQLVRQLDGFEAAIAREKTNVLGSLRVPVDNELQEFEREERSLLRQRRLAETVARRRAVVAFVALPLCAIALLGWLLLAIRRQLEQRRAAERNEMTLNVSLSQRANELEAANRELESVGYTASHDLRGPLRAIASFSSILHDEHLHQLDAEGQRLLQAVEANAGKMAELLDGLLSYSRLGRIPLHKTAIDHADIVRRVIELLAAEDAQAKTAIHVARLPAGTGDPGLMAEVWTHLLRNSIKFSRSRERPRIEVGAAEGAAEVTFHVRDNGVGFDMQHSGKLFGVFERLHHEHQFPGRGLGLAAAHRIVARHGGRMWAEASPDEGATFFFSLPREPA